MGECESENNYKNIFTAPPLGVVESTADTKTNRCRQFASRVFSSCVFHLDGEQPPSVLLGSLPAEPPPLLQPAVKTVDTRAVFPRQPAKKKYEFSFLNTAERILLTSADTSL